MPSIIHVYVLQSKKWQEKKHTMDSTGRDLALSITTTNSIAMTMTNTHSDGGCLFVKKSPIVLPVESLYTIPRLHMLRTHTTATVIGVG